METSKITKRRVSISGMLKFLGVSRSGYRAFLNRKLSPTRQRKDAVDAGYRAELDRIEEMKRRTAEIGMPYTAIDRWPEGWELVPVGYSKGKGIDILREKGY